MAATKPTIIIILGFWHTTEPFGALTALLKSVGYPIVPLPLPSNGAHPGHADFSHDVAAVRSAVTSLADTGKDVVVLMHSGGSVAGSEALRGLGKLDREKEGKKGGVVRCVYIGILLPKAGTSMFETFNSVVSSPDLDPDFEIDTEQKFFVVADDGTGTISDEETRFYGDLKPEEASYWAKRLTSCSLGVMMSTFTYEAWKHIPSAYVICLKDKSIPLKQVREIVKEANIEMVLEIETGHCPFLGQPETIAKFVRKAAGETI